MKKGSAPFPLKSSAPPGLVSVNAGKNLILILKFSNGKTRKVDFKKLDLVGLLKPLRDQKFFEQVEYVEGFPTWPNGLDLDPDVLWELGEAVEVAAKVK